MNLRQRLVNWCLRRISDPWIPYTARFANQVVVPFVERHYYTEG